MPPVFAVVFRRPQLDDGPMIDSTQPNAGAVLGRPTTNPAEGGHPAPARCRAVVLACVDSDAVEPLRSLLSSRGLAGDCDLVCWPGGAPRHGRPPLRDQQPPRARHTVGSPPRDNARGRCADEQEHVQNGGPPRRTRRADGADRVAVRHHRRGGRPRARPRAGDRVITLAVVVAADLAPTGRTGPPRLRHELHGRLPAVFSAAGGALDDAPAEGLVLFGARVWAVAAELGRVDYRGAVLSAGRWPGGRRAPTKLALGATTPVLIAGRPVRPACVQPSATTHKLVHTPGSHR